MSDSYKFTENSSQYFVTLTTIGWVDIFTRKVYRDIIIDSLKYCQLHKGLIISAYVIMSNHIHIVIAAKENYSLSDTMRDFKKHTSKQIMNAIQVVGESRKEWLLNKFSYEASRVVRGKNYKLWKDGYHAKEIISDDMLIQKVNYIHRNPVEAGIVLSEEEYLYSSAKNYAGQTEILLDVQIVS